MTSHRRRNVLKFLLASPLAACQIPLQSDTPKNVVVVGAGIIGASIAYHLARAGAQVTVIDRAGPATHASRGTLAWINATWAKQPQNYHTLAQQSIIAWRRLAGEMELPIRWSGSIEWFQDPEREAILVEQIREQAEWGEPARMLGAAELASLEPQIKLGNATQAAFSGNDGAVDPIVTTQTLLRAAQAYGAKLVFPSELLDIDEGSAGRVVVQTSTGTLLADRVVLATGAAVGAAAKFAESPIPQRTTPGIIGITRPLPRIIEHVLSGPGVGLHQRSDGRIVIGEHTGPPDSDAHAQRLQDRPNNYPTQELAMQHAMRMRQTTEAFLPAISTAEFEEVFIGWRPLPLDGHPVIGPSARHPNVYLTVMHSGVTLAPIVGELVTEELLTGRVMPQLSSFRPDREFRLVRRY